MQNEDKLLIQVVPRLTPTRCGVSDHTIALADELNSSFGIQSAFVVVNSEERCQVPYRAVYCNPSQLLTACCLLSGKCRSAILVHVSGYGYSKDGAPRALADGLRKVEQSGRFRQAAYFHELYYNYSTPWKKAFWYSHRQRREVARIAEMCSLVVTNTSQHASWLQGRKNPDAALIVLPVFSNVGECSTLPDWNDRRAALIVFGQSDTRRRAYQRLAHMAASLESLGVQEIIDIGADADVAASLGGLQVRCMGPMASGELGKLISSTRFGFVRFTPNELAKSGVMASLCAFGAVPVLAQSFAGEIDGLCDGKQVVSPSTVGSTSFGQCSRAAWDWYQQHNSRAHACLYSKWMSAKNLRELAAGGSR